MGAKTNNSNAKKGNDTATSFIHARCTPADKNEWTKAAQADGLKLTEWIIKNLNSASKKQCDD